MQSWLIGSRHRPGCKLYKRRWAFLFTLLLLQVVSGFLLTSLAEIGNVFGALWGINVYMLQWLTLTFDVGPIAFIIPFSYAVAMKWFTFRTLTLAAGYSSTIGLLCLACSVALRSLYPLALVGQVFNSFTATLLIASPGIFGVLWFPEEQVGTTIALNIMSLYVGSIIGLVVPPTALTIPTSVNTTIQSNQTWLVQDRVYLAAMFSSLFFVALVCAVLLFIFITDHPPMPPTKAQLMKIKKQDEASTFTTYIQLVKSLLKNRTYLLACFVFGILFQAKVMEFKVLPLILTQMFAVSGIHYSPYATAEYIMIAFFVGAVFGVAVGGEVIDRYKRYNVVSIVGCLLSFIWTICQVLALIFGSLPLFFASSALYGFCSQLGIVAVHEIILEETYPTDEVFAAIWLAVFKTTLGVFYGEIGKVLSIASGGLAVLIFLSVNLLLSVLLSWFFVIHNHRLHVEEMADDYDLEVNESSSLITSDQ